MNEGMEGTKKKDTSFDLDFLDPIWTHVTSRSAHSLDLLEPARRGIAAWTMDECILSDDLEGLRLGWLSFGFVHCLDADMPM